MNDLKDFGFRPDKIEADHYLSGFGQLPFEAIQLDGNWKPYSTIFEPQSKQFETFNCTGVNTLKCLQTLQKRKYGIDINYSERWAGICAGTSSQGNSPHVVAETIRTCGLIPEFRLPFSDELKNINEYYSLGNEDEEKLTSIAEDWLKSWSFGHEWVFNSDSPPSLEVRQNLMVEALKTSPLGVSVQAWPPKNEKGLYTSSPIQNPNHWTCCIISYKEGEYWEVYDSYIADGEPFKKLAWDYDFKFVKRYTIEKKSQKVESWFVRLLNLIKKLFNL